MLLTSLSESHAGRGSLQLGHNHGLWEPVAAGLRSLRTTPGMDRSALSSGTSVQANTMQGSVQEPPEGLAKSLAFESAGHQTQDTEGTALIRA